MTQTATELQEERILLNERTEKREKKQKDAEEMLLAMKPPFETFLSNFGYAMPLDILLGHAGQPREAEALIRLLLYKENTELQKLPIPQSKALDLIELPEGYYAYVNSLTSLTAFLTRASYKYVDKTPLDYFSLEEGTLALNEAFYQNLDATTRRYASPKEAAFIKECEGLVSRLNALEEENPGIQLIEFPKNAYSINTIFYKSPKTGEIKLNLPAIRIEEE